MASVLTRLEPLAYAALRIVAGFLFIFHGLQKFGLFGGRTVEPMSQLGVASLIEIVGGTFIMVGFQTVPMAFIASGEMACAYFIAHHPRGGWPIQNSGEVTVLYSFILLYVATHGPGRWSLDYLWNRR